jgi:hypothetical protein
MYMFFRAIDHTNVMKPSVVELIALVLSKPLYFVTSFIEFLCTYIFTSMLSVFCVCPGLEMRGLSSSRDGFIVFLYPDR